MNPSEKPIRNDEDFNEGLESEAIPADEDIQKGEEEEEKQTELPLAMPPGA